MIDAAQIHQVSDEIARRFQPERIILFGSYAYGTPTEDSDVDLLVIMPFEGRTAKQAVEIRGAVYAGFAMDLIPITPEKLKYRLEINDFFCGRLSRKGRSFMMPATQEWVDRVEEDWDIAGLTFRSRKTPRYNGCCFHAQQCAEKYLKAQLQEETLTIPKIHDLGKLLDLLLPAHPLWAAMRPTLDLLTVYAAAIRYPGDSADKEEAQEAMRLCRGVRQELRLSLGLPV